MTAQEMKERASAWAGKARVELKFGKRRADGGLSISGGGEKVLFSTKDDSENFETELGYWFGNRTTGGTKCR